MEDTKVNINLIWLHRNNFVRSVGRYPDYVMIHPNNRTKLLEEAQETLAFELMESERHHCFGMKVIWTTEIKEDDVICTCSGNDKL